LLDSRMELLAIGRGVIEAELGGKYVVSKIRETGVVSGLGSKPIHLIKQRGQFSAALDIRCTGSPERRAAH